MDKLTQSIRSFSLLLLLTFLAGCIAEVKIVSPENGAVSDQLPEFRLRFKNDVPADFVATLNGTRLPPNNFSIDGKDAFIQISRNQLREGNNIFAVTKPADTATIFNFDVVGPVIHILSAEGTNQKRVQGYLSDKSGPASLTINGSNIALSNDFSFDTNIPAARLYTAVATDTLGYQSEKRIIKLEETFNSAIGARVNKQALDESIPKAILKVLESTDFNKAIKNPVANKCQSLWLASACAKFTISNVNLSPGSIIKIQALSANRMRVFMELSRLSLTTKATTYGRCKTRICGGNGKIFGTLNFSGTTTVSKPEVNVQFVVNVNNDKFNVEFVPGSIDIDLPFNAIAINIDFGAIEDIPLIGSAIKSIVNGIVSGFASIISSLVADVIDGFLAAPVSSLINGFLTDLIPNAISLPVADTEMQVGFSPQSFSTSNNGINLALSNSITIDAQDNSVLPPLGSLFVTGSAPNPLPQVTRNNTAVDLTATLSANLLNQALTEAYKGGVMNIKLDQANGLTVGAIASIPDIPINLTGVSDFNIQISAATSPEISVTPQLNAADGVVFLSLLDMNLRLNANFNNGRGMQEILNTTVDLRTPFDIGITPDNKLTVGIEAVPDVNVQGFTFRINGLILSGGSNSVISNLIATIAPQLIPKALQSLGAIPVPAIQGFSLQLIDIWNPNPSNTAFMSLGANLVSVARSAAAAKPTTLAVVEQRLKIQSTNQSNTPNEQRSATILVDGHNPEEGLLEYRYRINKGHWTVWKHRERIELSYLPSGDNQVEVCSRTQLLQQDCTQVAINVPFPTPPTQQ